MPFSALRSTTIGRRLARHLTPIEQTAPAGSFGRREELTIARVDLSEALATLRNACGPASAGHERRDVPSLRVLRLVDRTVEVASELTGEEDARHQQQERDHSGEGEGQPQSDRKPRQPPGEPAHAAMTPHRGAPAVRSAYDGDSGRRS